MQAASPYKHAASSSTPSTLQCRGLDLLSHFRRERSDDYSDFTGIKAISLKWHVSTSAHLHFHIGASFVKIGLASGQSAILNVQMAKCMTVPFRTTSQ